MIGEPLAAGAVQVGVTEEIDVIATDGVVGTDGAVAMRVELLEPAADCPTAFTALTEKT